MAVKPYGTVFHLSHMVSPGCAPAASGDEASEVKRRCALRVTSGRRGRSRRRRPAWTVRLSMHVASLRGKADLDVEQWIMRRAPCGRHRDIRPAAALAVRACHVSAGRCVVACCTPGFSWQVLLQCCEQFFAMLRGAWRCWCRRRRSMSRGRINRAWRI